MLLFFWLQFFWDEPPEKVINGVSLVSPRGPVGDTAYVSLQQINANFVAMIPYAFCPKDRPAVIFDHPRQWWGERINGMAQMVADARSLGFSVMVKPHLWVKGDGWPGDLQFDEEGWKLWEKDYRDYILKCAMAADSLEVEMFCIGTEVRHSASGRSAFWRGLIVDVKKIYSGKLTYAANWDNYNKINFWSDLDYIGVDAYWPLDSSFRPTEEDLLEAWVPIRNELRSFSSDFGRKIIFTEYGYQSIEGTAARAWERKERRLNLEAQALAYRTIYNVFWKEPWFAGGFLWKWYLNDRRGGVDDRSYTPQGKPAATIIRRQYGVNAD